MVYLPDDIFLAIFAHLEIEDIPQLRAANKKIFQLTKSGSFWRALLQAHFISKNLPLPGARDIVLQDLQGPQLEALLKRAYQLHRNWTSPHPVAKDVSTLNTQPQGRIVFLQFLKQQSGSHWLLSLSVRVAGGLVPHLNFECWDVSPSTSATPVCIARKEFHQFVTIAVNQESAASDGRGIVAVQAPFITIYSIRPSPDDPDSGFHPLMMFPEQISRNHNPANTTSVGGLSRIYLYSGTKIVTAQQDGRILVLDTARPNDRGLELRNSRFPGPVQASNAVLAASLIGGCITLVRPTVCEQYALPSVTASSGASTSTSVLSPVSEFIWPWKVDSVVLSSHQSHRRRRQNADIVPTIAMLIRFGSGFPWPINLLHRFDIIPNTHFISTQPIDQTNLPYRFPPVVRQTIASPLRLFAQTDMVLGPHGTAIWIDSHTEDQFGHAEQGQRLAARMTAGMLESSNAGEAREAREEDDDDEEQEISDSIATTMAASVMSWNEVDGWVKLAMDEEEGQVALGDREGGITLLSYI